MAAGIDENYKTGPDKKPVHLPRDQDIRSENIKFIIIFNSNTRSKQNNCSITFTLVCLISVGVKLQTFYWWYGDNIYTYFQKA
jgi:hypothetical protein